MAKDVINLDSEFENNNAFRYNTLVNLFGKEEADKIVNGPDIELDKDVQKVLDEQTDVIPNLE